MKVAYSIKYIDPDHVDRLFEHLRNKEISWRGLGVGIALASFINRDSGEAWPSRATLQYLMGIDKRDITYELRKLEKIGFITIQANSGGSNTYRIPPRGDIDTPRGQIPPWDAWELPPGGGIQHQPLVSTPTPGNTASHNNKNKSNYGVGPYGGGSQSITPPDEISWNGEAFEVSHGVREMWMQKYPEVSIEAELVKAAVWLAQKDGRIGDIVAFLDRWMSRARKDASLEIYASREQRGPSTSTKEKLPPGHSLQSMYKALGMTGDGDYDRE